MNYTDRIPKEDLVGLYQGRHGHCTPNPKGCAVYQKWRMRIKGQLANPGSLRKTAVKTEFVLFSVLYSIVYSISEYLQGCYGSLPFLGFALLIQTSPHFQDNPYGVHPNSWSAPGNYYYYYYYYRFFTPKEVAHEYIEK